MTINTSPLKEAIAVLAAFADSLDGNPPGTFMGQPVAPGGNAEMVEQYRKQREAKLALDAPYGREADGSPAQGPATRGLKAMWNAAQHVAGPDGLALFNIFDYVPGIQAAGVPPNTPKYAEGGVAKLELDVIALSKTPWAHFWMSYDANAIMVDPGYQMQINGYIVTKNPDDTYKRTAV